MFRALRRAWKNYIDSVPQGEFVDSIPESQWDQADLQPKVSKMKRKAFIDLLSLIYGHLPREDAVKLVQRGSADFTRGDDADTALGRALVPDEQDEHVANRGVISCDWRAADEVQWQAHLLCKAHGVSSNWQAPEGSLAGVLQSFAEDLQSRNLRLFSFSVGDMAFAFAVQPEEVAPVLALGKQLQIAIRSASEA